MDLAAIAGLLASLLLVAQAAGRAALIHPPALVLVLLGGFAALLVAHPLRQAINIFALFAKALFGKTNAQTALTYRIVELAGLANRDGILALEKELRRDDDPFLSAGLRLAVDGTHPDLIMDILETELRFIEERHAHNQQQMHFLGRAWAVFGLIGALLLLAQNAPSELVVLPALYGALLYGLFAIPCARKLEVYSQSEVLGKKIIIESVMSIQSKDNPRITAHKIAVFVQPKERLSEDPPLPPAKPQPALPALPADFAFVDITQLADHHIQALLRETSQKDVVSALKETDHALKERILSCMSGRVRSFIEEEINAAQVAPDETRAAQGRMVAQLRQLAASGDATS